MAVNRSFSASIRRHGEATMKQAQEIARDSIQDIMEMVMTSQPSVKITGGSFEVGKIPVDDADLINSLVSYLNGSMGPHKPGATSYTAVISELQIGDTATFAFTAAHAIPMELGFSGERKDGSTYEVPGRHFVGANITKWPQVVEANAVRILK